MKQRNETERKPSWHDGHAVPLETPKLTLKALSDLLANGFADRCGFDAVDFDKGDYEKAKARLADAMGCEDFFVEDVQAEMLFEGKSLRLHMAESADDEDWNDLTLEGVLKGLALYDADENFAGTARDVCNGDPQAILDFWDYDAILQYAVYGEVIIG